VVVVHEIFGLSDWVRGATDQLAEAGYLAIAPDLLSGMAPGGGGTAELGGPDAVRKAIGALPPDQVTADLQAVSECVGQLPAANGKVVIAGFCWGGAQAFRFATNNRQLKAAFVFYGPGPDQEDAIARITAPRGALGPLGQAPTRHDHPDLEQPVDASSTLYRALPCIGRVTDLWRGRSFLGDSELTLQIGRPIRELNGRSA
jgi:pimeloyl-ACP methyl ester carboxylesterase